MNNAALKDQQRENFCSLVMITGQIFRRSVMQKGVCRFSVKTKDGSNLFVQGDLSSPGLAQLQQGQEVAVVGHLESMAGKCGLPHGKIIATGVSLLNIPDTSRGIVAGLLEMWEEG